ncbi:MAG: DUF3891 family protein [Fuerstiella sp.]
MLKTEQNSMTRLVSQPDHAAVSGYLAAHWGNKDFVKPGYYAAVPDPEVLRAEVVFGIAQHDNGWWEWEATPELGSQDGLPLGLTQVVRNRQAGMDRWRHGIPRFQKNRPYASLLVSLHAYWLYAPTPEDSVERAFRHPLFGADSTPDPDEAERQEAEQFLRELKVIQDTLMSRLQADPVMAGWVEPDLLQPHARLVQLLDGMSLALCSALIPAGAGETRGPGQNSFDLPDVPRRGWHDRITIKVRPQGHRRLSCQPYPFDTDPLPVLVPAKFLPSDVVDERFFPVRWNAALPELVPYEFCSVSNDLV